MIEGRSSIARLGLTIHITAGFGDVGFCGKWTLELTAAQSIMIYPRMPIGQLYWIWTSKTTRKYKGKYQDQKETMASKSYEDYRRES
jgi:dCTP deaminase